MYQVQIFTMVTEAHLSKEMSKRAAEGWQVASTAVNAKNGHFIVTWLWVGPQT